MDSFVRGGVLSFRMMSFRKMAKIREKIKIYGRVHGVFFRESAKEKAKELNVSCEAFNMPDGTVEIVLEGEKENVSRVTEWCKTGPPLAQVEKIKTIEHVNLPS